MLRAARAGLVVLGVLAGAAASFAPAAVAQSAVATQSDAGAQAAGLTVGSVVLPPGDSRSVSSPVAVAESVAATAGPAVAPLGRLRQADVIVVAKTSLPAGALAALRHLRGVSAAEPLDAARVVIDGTYVAMIGADPSSFRVFAARPTAASDKLWQNVQAGGVAVSYTMGRQDHLPLPGTVPVVGRSTLDLPIAGFATVGIGGIDAVVSHQTAAALGLPAGNAIVVSAARAASIPSLVRQVKRLVPAQTAVQQLVFEVATGRSSVASSGVAGGASAGGALIRGQVTSMLNAALSRRGLPYVWGGSGPYTFDCSGLVQWSFAQAGIVMPRVAADQARTGPLIPFSQARAGDLLFWRTDPTAPDYISHVAIYLGNGWMIQAPQPGENVEVVRVVFGAGFAGVVQVHPQVAGSVPG
jgi:cell wall-associated NlpC family hydrolase